MTDKQKDAILQLCELVTEVMCFKCDDDCDWCGMNEWIKEIKRTFEEGEAE